MKIGKAWPSVAILWLWFFSWAQAQNVDAFVQVHMSPSQVVNRQPIKVKVTAYSSTWFAQPLDFQNVQIPNAFILPFARTQSGIHYVNDKKYAGLEFFFLVFPYQEGEYVFPALEIKTSIPPEGDYLGTPITLKSAAKPFSVSSVPGGQNAPDMVAKNVYISEKWSADLSQVKVGDVVTRKLFIRAKGTLPSFISDAAIDDLSFASVYSKKATLKDERDSRDANGLRTEEHAYLFESAGAFTIPPLKISWWNPYVKRKYEKELASIEIQVSENPNLGLVNSVRDSLDQLKNDKLVEEGAQVTWRDIMPMAIRYLVYMLSILFLWWLMRTIFKKIVASRKAYLDSEKYHFDQLKKKNNWASLYRWYDEFRKERNLPPEIRRVIAVSIDGKEDWVNIINQVGDLRKSDSVDKSVKTDAYTINP